MPSPLADITRFLSGYRQGQLEAEDREYVRGQRALEAQDRAAVIQETGYSPSVLKAQQIRMNMEKMRREAEDDRIARVSGNAARLIAMGRTQEGTKMLADNGLDAVQAEDDPNDPNFVHFSTQGGKYRVPRTAAALIAADPIQFAKNEYALDKMLADQQFKAAEAEKRRVSVAEEKQKDRDLRLQLAARAARNAVTRSGAKSAVLQVVDSLASNYVQNEGMDPVAARARAFREYALKETDSKSRAQAISAHKGYLSAVKDILDPDVLKEEAGALKTMAKTPRQPSHRAPAESGGFKIGTIIRNPKTGERMKWTGTNWAKVS